jgi:hypothetical protein
MLTAMGTVDMIDSHGNSENRIKIWDGRDLTLTATGTRKIELNLMNDLSINFEVSTRCNRVRRKIGYDLQIIMSDSMQPGSRTNLKCN